MKSTEDVLMVEHEGPITWLSLNRPERLNALNGSLLASLDATLHELQTRQETRVVIIKGNGRSFCAGYDIESDGAEVSEAADRDPVSNRLRLDATVELFMRIWRHPKPVIAAVHGFCLAGGAQLATLCDLTIVTTTSQIGVPSLPIGGGFISPMWVPLVGAKRAKQMTFMTGERIDGATAADWGWANYAVQDDALLDEARRVATVISRTPADVLTIKKYAVNRAADIAGWSTVMGLGGETDALLHTTDSVSRVHERIAEHGMKDTIAAFQAGTLFE